MSGHSAGNNYTVSAAVQGFFPQEKQIGKWVQTLDGEGHGVLDRIETHWQIQTTELEASEWDNWQELFASATPADSVTVNAEDLPGGLPNGNISGTILAGSGRLSAVDKYGRFTASFALREVG